MFDMLTETVKEKLGEIIFMVWWCFYWNRSANHGW